MRYTTTAQGNRHTEVLNEQQQVIGQIDYLGWGPQRARLTTRDGVIYEVCPKGFWATTRIVLKNDLPYAEVKPNMGKGLYINFENGTTLSLKKKNWWGIASYILIDNEGQQIATIETAFSWKGMGYICDMDIIIPLQQREDMTVFPLLLAYCTRYLRVRM